jgi:hypothetical protein
MAATRTDFGAQTRETERAHEERKVLGQSDGIAGVLTSLLRNGGDIELLAGSTTEAKPSRF